MKLSNYFGNLDINFGKMVKGKGRNNKVKSVIHKVDKFVEDSGENPQNINSNSTLSRKHTRSNSVSQETVAKDAKVSKTQAKLSKLSKSTKTINDARRILVRNPEAKETHEEEAIPNENVGEIPNFEEMDIVVEPEGGDFNTDDDNRESSDSEDYSDTEMNDNNKGLTDNELNSEGYAESEVILNIRPQGKNYFQVGEKDEGIEEYICKVVDKRLYEKEKEMEKEFERRWQEKDRQQKSKTPVKDIQKSPSDTILYAPGLIKTPEMNRVINTDVLNNPRSPARVGINLIDRISNFVEEMRKEEETRWSDKGKSTPRPSTSGRGNDIPK